MSDTDCAIEEVPDDLVVACPVGCVGPSAPL